MAPEECILGPVAFPLIGGIGDGRAWPNDSNASWCPPEMVTSRHVLVARREDLSGSLRVLGIQKPCEDIGL